MNKKLLRNIAIFAVVTLLSVACLPLSALGYSYETDGLEALYIGNENTGADDNTWKDLSGNGYDITEMPDDDDNYFTADAYRLDSIKVMLPNALKDVINGTEFTIELTIGDFVPGGDTWNTLISSDNDSLALYRIENGNSLYLKSETSPTAANKRPSVGDAENLIKNSTITVTFKLNEKVKIYVDGELESQENAENQLNLNNLFIGHDATHNRYFAAEFRSIRIYSTALTASQIEANYQADLAQFDDDDNGDDSSDDKSVDDSDDDDDSSSETPSSQDESSKDDSKNPKTGDNFIYIYFIVAIIAAGFMTYIVRSRKTC